MRISIVIGAIATLAVAGIAAAPAYAESLRWPAQSKLPKTAPSPAPPPSVLERPASVVAKLNYEHQHSSRQSCEKGRVCVVCVAACDLAAPVVVHQQKSVPTGATSARSPDNDSDGVSADAPRFARPAWASIECGAESGCRVSGVLAPSRPREVHITIFSSSGSTSRYID